MHSEFIDNLEWNFFAAEPALDLGDTESAGSSKADLAIRELNISKPLTILFSMELNR
jgi:hypothetical protein